MTVRRDAWMEATIALLIVVGTGAPSPALAADLITNRVADVPSADLGGPYDQSPYGQSPYDQGASAGTYPSDAYPTATVPTGGAVLPTDIVTYPGSTGSGTAAAAPPYAYAVPTTTPPPAAPRTTTTQPRATGEGRATTTTRPPTTTTTTRPTTTTTTTTTPPTTTTTAPVTPPPGGRTAAKALDWGEPTDKQEFTDATLTGWTREAGTEPADVTVKDGVLTLGATKGTPTGLAWAGATAVPRTYGRWEARVKLPVGRPDLRPVLLLTPDAGPPAGGRVDFLRATEPTRRLVEASLHHGDADAQRVGTVPVSDLEWHNWAVEWTRTGVYAYLDGVLWFKVTDAAVLPPPRPMHVSVRLERTPNAAASTAAAQVQVESVRFYPAPA